MQSLTTPTAISGPFANSQVALKNVIPNAAADVANVYNASMELGFPAVTMQPIDRGGTPPDGKDFNGILNVVSQFYFQFQNGFHPTFDSNVSTAIGGYPQGAVLWYFPAGATKMLPVMSLIPNNTYDFVSDPTYIDGVHWTVAWSSNYLGEQDLGNATALTTVDFSGPGAAIKKIAIPDTISTLTITLGTPVSNVGTYTWELHITPEHDNTLPLITWAVSSGTLVWLSSSLQQLQTIGKTAIFVFRWMDGKLIANYGGSY